MNEPGFAEVIVVGGGISGLTAAWHLKKAGVNVALLEATSAVGGCMQTRHRDGFLLEQGPFNVMVRDPAFEDLLAALSDDVKVVTADKSANVRFIYKGGRLVKVPTGPLALTTSPILSFAGKCRAVAGLFLSRRGGAADYTLEEFAVRRFGREVADTLLSALVSGILAGDISKLSAKSCFPALWRFDQASRSPLGFELARLARKKKKRKRRWPGLVSFDHGLGAIGEALAARLGDHLLTECRVESIVLEQDGYSLNCLRADPKRHTLRCRRLVMALPAAPTARLLRPLYPEAMNELARIESASLAVLNLAFRREDVGHPMRGFGFLVPRNEPDFAPMGVLWADSAFPHHGRADCRLLRVFLGGPRMPDVNAHDDDALVTAAIQSLRNVLQLSGEPALVDICRFPHAIPQYHLGHNERIERLRTLCASAPRLHLVGNYLEGVSINDCVRLATRVAGDIVRACENEPSGAPLPRWHRETVFQH